jgi:hypothetical protein
LQLGKLNSEVFGKSFRFSNTVIDTINVRLFRNDQRLGACDCEKHNNHADDTGNQTDTTTFRCSAIDKSKSRSKSLTG